MVKVEQFKIQLIWNKHGLIHSSKLKQKYTFHKINEAPLFLHLYTIYQKVEITKTALGFWMSFK